MTYADFLDVLNGVARTWKEGNPVAAAEYFHEQAVYEEPPQQQFYEGRDSILQFFTSVMNGDPPLHMRWHNAAFDPQTQVGFGEYTFARLKQFHGIVVMHFRDGKILKWREYQYQSELKWDDFTGRSGFETFG